MSFEEQIMSADKHPSIFSRQMKAIGLYIPGKGISTTDCFENIKAMKSKLGGFYLNLSEKNLV